MLHAIIQDRRIEESEGGLDLRGPGCEYDEALVLAYAQESLNLTIPAGALPRNAEQNQLPHDLAEGLGPELGDGGEVLRRAFNKANATTEFLKRHGADGATVEAVTELAEKIKQLRNELAGPLRSKCERPSETSSNRLALCITGQLRNFWECAQVSLRVLSLGTLAEQPLAGQHCKPCD